MTNSYLNIKAFKPAQFWLPLLITMMVLAGCGAPEDAETEAAVASPTSDASAAEQQRQVRVETLLLSPSAFDDVIEVTGSVEAYNDATVSAQGSGTLVYRVQRGAYVRRGGRIAQIDSTLTYASYQQVVAQVASAQAQYDLASDTYARQEPLYQDSIISAIEFESVRAQYNQASAQLNQAKAVRSQLREQLDNTRITASFGGTVETYFAEVGEQVMPGAQIARIVNTNRVKIAAGVPERYANDIKVGAPVKIMLDAYGGAEYDGIVNFAGSAINVNNRTFPVEIQLDNASQTLKPEMVARLFLTRQSLQDVIVIPQDAVPLDETGHSVFVVIDEGGTLVAERRPVTLGPAYGGNVVVEQGLYAGDEVVVRGQYNLTSGDAVEVVNTTQSTIAALDAQEQ